MKFFKNIIFAFSTLLFTACSYPEFDMSMEFERTDYNEIVSQLISKSKNQLYPNLKESEVMLVPNFSETHTLKGDSKLSFILSDILKNELISNYNITVREIELSRSFKIGTEGFKILSRNSKDINNSITKARYAAVGTFALTKNQLLVFLKFTDIRSGSVVASSTLAVDLTQEILDSYNSKLEKAGPKVFAPLTL